VRGVRVGVANSGARPAIVLAAVGVVWGTIGVIVRDVPLPAVVIVSGRVWFAALTLAVLRRWRRQPLFAGAIHSRVAVASGALLAAHWVALFAALQRAPIGTVLLITYLAPVGIAALAPRVLGERVPVHILVALGIAAVGTAIVVQPSSAGGHRTGIVLALLAACSYVALTLVSKPQANQFGASSLALVQFTVAGVVLVPFAAAAHWGHPRWSWLWVVLLGIVHTAGGVSLLWWALTQLPATTTGVFTYLEPASAVLFGWVFLHEKPSSWTLVGGMLVVAAGIMVVRASAGPANVRIVKPERAR